MCFKIMYYTDERERERERERVNEEEERRGRDTVVCCVTLNSIINRHVIILEHIQLVGLEK